MNECMIEQELGMGWGWSPSWVSVVLGLCVSVPRPDLPSLMSLGSTFRRGIQDALGMTSARNLPPTAILQMEKLSPGAGQLPKATEQGRGRVWI